MKHWKQIAALFLSGALVLSLSACGSGDGLESPSAGASAQPSGQPVPGASPAILADLSQGALEFSAGVSPADTMLTVNGEAVPAERVLYLLDQVCLQTQQYMSLYGASLADSPEAAGGLLERGVQLAVYHTLTRQKAAELGCLLTDEQNAQVQAAMDQADLAAKAPYWGLTDQGARAIFEMNYYYDNVFEAVTHAPSEEELNGYLYRVKHILLKTVDDSRQPLPEDQVAEKKAQAEELLAQLQAAEDLPALFDQLMDERSEDGRTQDGALAAPDGYLAAPGDMVAEFEAASQALEVGELSDLVETAYGYHIILRLPTAITQEEMAQPEYTESFRAAAMEAQMAQWMEQAQVERSQALEGLDAIDFFLRLDAYQQALAERDAPAESAPIESGGLG